jgi:hypothetical protein
MRGSSPACQRASEGRPVTLQNLQRFADSRLFIARRGEPASRCKSTCSEPSPREEAGPAAVIAPKPRRVFLGSILDMKLTPAHTTRPKQTCASDFTTRHTTGNSCSHVDDNRFLIHLPCHTWLFYRYPRNSDLAYSSIHEPSASAPSFQKGEERIDATFQHRSITTILRGLIISQGSSCAGSRSSSTNRGQAN